MRRSGRQFFAEEVGQGSCPRCVDEAMADVAIVFHWGPADMDPLSLSDLMEWRERAITRWEQTHGK
ncbi:hypothetical protein PPUJ20066_08190 [Pseudomonas putida]|nr:hypothetical protein PPUJ20066_08190 [Pseudomonas putida]